MTEAETALAPLGGELFTRIFQHAAIGMTVVDRDGRLVAANPALLTMLGYDRDELLGKTFSEISHPAELSETRASFAELTRGDRQHFMQVKRYLRKDEQAVWARLTVSATDPDLAYFVGMIEDLTEHKRAERRHAIRLAVTRQLAEAPSAEAALEAIVDAMGRSLEWEYGELWMLDMEAERLVPHLSWFRGSPEQRGGTEEGRPGSLEKGFGLPGRVWAERRPVWLQDARQEADIQGHALAHGLQGAIAFPIVSGPDFLGVMAFYCRHLEEPDAELLAMMADIGSQVDQYLMRRRAEEKLLRLGSVLAATDDAILSLTPEGDVGSWNHAVEAVYGYAPSELAGRPVTILIPPERLAEGRELLAKARGGERIEHFETVRLRQDGTRVDVSLTIAPVWDSQGRLCCITKVIRDITVRKQAERYKDEFLSVLSHELKTPLNFIMGFASILADDEDLTEAQRNGVTRISEGADRLYLMIRNLLCLSDILAGRFRISPEHAQLDVLVHEAVLTLRALAEQKGLCLEIDLPESGEVHVDGSRIIQLLAILVENAIKFTPAGGSIRIAARTDGGHLELTVSDTGIGIEPADQARLFTRLQQLDMSSTRQAGGLGVGLSLCKAIAEAHGGTIGVESRRHEGSTFRVRMPLQATPN